MLNMRRATLVTCCLAFAAAPAAAQSEAEMRDFFEGKSVRVKIDMPASQEGIDVFPDARRPLDFAGHRAASRRTASRSATATPSW